MCTSCELAAKEMGHSPCNCRRRKCEGCGEKLCTRHDSDHHCLGCHNKAGMLGGAGSGGSGSFYSSPQHPLRRKFGF